MRGRMMQFHHCGDCGGIMEFVMDRQGDSGVEHVTCCRYCGQEVRVPVQGAPVEPATPRLPASGLFDQPS